MPAQINHLSKKKRISIKQPIVSYQHKKVTLSESIDSKNHIKIKLHKPLRNDLKYLCTNLGYIQPSKLIVELVRLTVKNLKSSKKSANKDSKSKKINLGRVTNVSGLHPTTTTTENEDIEKANVLFKKLLD